MKMQSGLFDGDPREEEKVMVRRVSAFCLAPHDLFLSWPIRQQLAHCAARDRDSAAQADTPEKSAWFLERAAGYQI